MKSKLAIGLVLLIVLVEVFGGNTDNDDDWQHGGNHDDDGDYGDHGDGDYGDHGGHNDKDVITELYKHLKKCGLYTLLQTLLYNISNLFYLLPKILFNTLYIAVKLIICLLDFFFKDVWNNNLEDVLDKLIIGIKSIVKQLGDKLKTVPEIGKPLKSITDAVQGVLKELTKIA